MPMFIWTANPDGNLDYFNNYWYQLSGLTYDQSKGTGWTKILNPEQLRETLEIWVYSLKTGQPFEHEIQLLDNQTGKYEWFLIKAKAQYNTNKEIIKWFGFSTNIQKQKDYQTLILDNELYFRNVADNIPIMIWGSDPEGNCIYKNKYWFDFTNTNFDENKGKEWLNLVYPDDMERVKKTFFESHLNQETIFIDYRIKTYNGEYKWIVDIGEPRFDYKGEFVGFLGVIADINKRKTMEEELKEKDRLYSMVLHGSDDAFWDLDIIKGEIFWSNKLFEILDYKKSDNEVITIDTFNSFLPSEDVERVGKLINESITENVDFKARFKMRHSSGKYIDVFSRGKTFYDENNKPVHFAGLLADITEQIEMLDKLDKQKIELERSNQELQQFAYIASHDLQSPLRSISGYTEILSRRYKNKLDDDADEFIDYIVSSTKKMQNLINDLLEYSRVSRDKLKFEYIDCNALVANAIKNLRADIREYEAEVNFTELPHIFAKESLLLRLFQNLISNAIKFHIKDVKPVINISAEQKDDVWLFKISDNGIGISLDYKDRIFQIFQRLHTDLEYKGTGIGLAVCKKIVEKHNGKIWFESELNKGTTFYFTIPVVKEDFIE